MKLIRNTLGISKLLLIVLLLAVFVLGAILSYVWTMSYYAPLEFQLPGSGTLTIERVQFSLQDAYRFNVTILNPSFSPSGVSIARLAVLTADKVIHDLLEVSPSIPYTLAVGKSQTFDCNWNWWQYTGQAINVLAWVGDGSGATLQVVTPFVGFIISELEFNSSLSVHRFNVTVQNLESSATNVTIASIYLNSTWIPRDNITQQLPYTLNKGEAVKFTCQFNWTNYQGQSVTVTVTTFQRYEAESSVTTPLPVVLSITEVVYNVTHTDHFNLTIQNEAASPSDVTITQVTVEANEAVTYSVEITSPSIPQPLLRNSKIQLKCSWNWEDYKGQTVRITVSTSQGFTVSYQSILPTTP